MRVRTIIGSLDTHLLLEIERVNIAATCSVMQVFSANSLATGQLSSVGNMGGDSRTGESQWQSLHCMAEKKPNRRHFQFGPNMTSENDKPWKRFWKAEYGGERQVQKRCNSKRNLRNFMARSTESRSRMVPRRLQSPWPAWDLPQAMK